MRRLSLLFRSEEAARRRQRSRLLRRSIGVFLLVLSLSAGGLSARTTVETTTETVATSAGDVFEIEVRRRKTLENIADQWRKAFRSLADGGDFQSAANQVAGAAELARSEFDANHWTTRPLDELAQAIRSLADLPRDRQELYRDVERAKLLADIHASTGNKKLALTKMREALEKSSRAVGTYNYLTAAVTSAVADRECDLNEFDAALLHAKESGDFYKAHFGDRNPYYAQTLCLQGCAEYALNAPEPAEQHLRKGLAILQPFAAEGLEDGHVLVWAKSLGRLAHLLNDRGRYAEAERLARRATEVIAFFPKSASFSTDFAFCQMVIARSLGGQKKSGEATVLFNQLIRVCPTTTLASVYFTTNYAQHLRRTHCEQEADALEKCTRGNTSAMEEFCTKLAQRQKGRSRFDALVSEARKSISDGDDFAAAANRTLPSTPSAVPHGMPCTLGARRSRRRSTAAQRFSSTVGQASLT